MVFGHKNTYVIFFARIRIKRCVVFAKEWGVYEDGVNPEKTAVQCRRWVLVQCVWSWWWVIAFQ